MSIDTLFGVASKTKQFKIYLDDILLKNEDILNLEIKFDMFTYFTSAVLSYRDSYSMTNSNVVKISEENTIKIFITDRYGYVFSFNFKPIKISFDDTNKRVRVIIFQLVDEATMKMVRKTDSKSFSGKITDEFKNEYENLGVLTNLENFTFDEKHECTPENIISSSGDNEYDFFVSRLKMQGIAFWLSHNKLNLKEIDIKNFNDISDKVKYNTEISNRANIFKIYQFKRKNSSKTSIPIPTIKYTNTLGKVQETSTISIQDLVNKVELNGNASEFISSDSGNVVEVANSNGLKSETYTQLASMLKNNQIIIFVSGSFEYGDVGNIVDVKIGAKSPYSEQLLSGDPTASGKYVITTVVDKFVGTKFAQKITLSRFDNPKPLKT